MWKGGQSKEKKEKRGGADATHIYTHFVRNLYLTTFHWTHTNKIYIKKQLL